MSERFESLVATLRWHAQRQPERTLYTFLPTAESKGIELSYGEADARARALALHLREHAAEGDRALLLYPSSLEYPVAFLACLYAGITAVPAYPPDPGRAKQTLPRVMTIARDAGARLILTTQGLLEVSEVARAQAPEPDSIRCLTTDDVDASGADAWQEPTGLADKLAFLQYTSGSTATPKGVMVSHRNLIEHQRLAHRIFRRTGDVITVSWLPFYHDMGLIGSLLYPLYTGGHTVLMPPISFLRRPLQWLRNISNYRAEVSTAPNFAYDLCVRRATPEDLEDLDLSCWRLTVCGAEPLRASTLEAFAEKFKPFGFRVETFLPCYGGAEATLTMSGGVVEEAPVVTSFDMAALQENRAVPVERGAPGSRAYVACGRQMDEHELIIVDPDSGEVLGSDQVGEIWLRGPSVADGYWGQPERTAEVFNARTPDGDDGPFMRPGDLGFWHGEQLYVIGRLADRIVVDGRRYEPNDIELSIEDTEPALTSGTVAAFLGPQGEVCIAVESRRNRSEEELAELAQRTREVIVREHATSPHVILMVPQRVIARTSSGKIRRHAYAAAFRSGELETLYEKRY
jgi:acyl-CoA synthetase (AMP-forming)/AMP-acid ligase II